MSGLSFRIVHSYEDIVMNVIYFIYSLFLIIVVSIIVGSFYLLFISLGIVVSTIENLMQKIHNLFNKITKNDSVDI